MKLTEGKIWKKIIVYYVPLLMSFLLQQFYNAADAVVVGKYVGKEALSAVGGTTSILFGLIIGLFTGIASGSTVVVGKYFIGNETVLRKGDSTPLGESVAGGCSSVAECREQRLNAALTSYIVIEYFVYYLGDILKDLSALDEFLVVLCIVGYIEIVSSGTVPFGVITIKGKAYYCVYIRS